MTEKVDLSLVELHVGTLVDWTLSVGNTSGEVCAILGHALAVVLEAIPVEDRSERLLVLARALDAALDELEAISDDDPWPMPPMKH